MMGHQEGFDNIFQTLYNKLQPSYSIETVGDLSEKMINIGIPEEEVSTIALFYWNNSRLTKGWLTNLHSNFHVEEYANTVPFF